MDPFSYLSVLISIVIGLGLSHLLAGAARLVRHRAAVHPYAPVLLLLAMLFLLHVQQWWTVFDLRRVTRWLEARGHDLPTLRVEGDPTFDFTARRWTSLDLQHANKPHELQDSGRVWLNIDHRQQGIGSASVGPALPERYRVPRERTEWRARLSAR